MCTSLCVHLSVGLNSWFSLVFGENGNCSSLNAVAVCEALNAINFPSISAEPIVRHESFDALIFAPAAGVAAAAGILAVSVVSVVVLLTKFFGEIKISHLWRSIGCAFLFTLPANILTFIIFH